MTEILDEAAVSEMQAQLDRCAQTGQAYRVKWSDVKAIIATIKSLRAQADQIVEREAACCPEDVGFDEYIRSLQSQLEQLRAERETLIYWLLRAYQSGHREGWEAGPSTDETMDSVCNVLANRGFDPSLSDAARELIKTEPRY